MAEYRLKNNDLDPRRIHAHTVAVLSTGLLMWAYAFLAYSTISSPVPGIIGFICSTIHILSPFLFRVSADYFLICSVLLASGIIHQGTFAFYTGGFESVIVIWFAILPVLGGIIAGRKAAVLWAIITTIWAGIYMVLHLSGFDFPDLITYEGKFIARALIVFGWIFLGTCIVYVFISMNEDQERKLHEQSSKIDSLFRVLFHDLAGPLSRVSIGLGIYKKESNPENKEHGLDIAIKATETMLDITQNVKKMYAVSKGKLNNELAYYPLNHAMDYVRELYSMELEQKKITLEYNPHSYKGLELFVEPISFKNQVLGNAISNAIKFSPLNGKIKVSARPDTEYLIIEIQDHGIGMPENIRNSIFDISKKTSRLGTAGELGTGFGMHILKSFIEMYNGEVMIESQETQGTTIKLYIKGRWKSPKQNSID